MAAGRPARPGMGTVVFRLIRKKPLGAAGGVEAIFAIKAMETGMIPPTIMLSGKSWPKTGIGFPG